MYFDPNADSEGRGILWQGSLQLPINIHTLGIDVAILLEGEGELAGGCKGNGTLCCQNMILKLPLKTRKAAKIVNKRNIGSLL